MTSRLVITVPGEPIERPRARNRVAYADGKPFARPYHPKGSLTSKDSKEVRWAKSHAWSDAVMQAVLHALPPDAPWSGPIRCDIEFFMPRLKKHAARKYGTGELWHVNTPDRDNLQKAIEDAITKAGLWRDDKQSCDGRISKKYHAVESGPGVVITIEKIEEATR